METKIKYTDSGKKEIDNFLIEQRALLERFALQDKYIMGDEEIEITGSDIIKLKQRLDISYRNYRTNKSSFLKMTAYLYVVIGIGLTIFGLTYGYFKELLQSNKEQAMMIILGLSISILGIIASFYVIFKEKRQKDYEIKRRMMDELTGHNTRYN